MVNASGGGGSRIYMTEENAIAKDLRYSNKHYLKNRKILHIKDFKN